MIPDDEKIAETGSRYRMSNNIVINTDNATGHWEGEKPCWSEKEQQTLYRSASGRYYRERQPSRKRYPRFRWLLNEEAAAWLLVNGHDQTDDGWPEELTALADSIRD